MPRPFRLRKQRERGAAMSRTCQTSPSPLRLWLLGAGVRIDDVAGLELLRPQDRLMRGVAELLEIIRRYILELREHRARLRPVAVLIVGDLTGDCVERVG